MQDSEDKSRDSDDLMQNSKEYTPRAIVEATKVQLKAGKARISWLESMLAEAEERARSAEDEKERLEGKMVRLQESLDESRRACGQLAHKLKQTEGERMLLLYIIAKVAQAQSMVNARRNALFDSLERMRAGRSKLISRRVQPIGAECAASGAVGGPRRVLANPQTMVPRSRFTAHVHVNRPMSFLPFG